MDRKIYKIEEVPTEKKNKIIIIYKLGKLLINFLNKYIIKNKKQ